MDTSSEVSQCQLFSSTISSDMILEYLHQRVMIFSSERIVIYLDQVGNDKMVIHFTSAICPTAGFFGNLLAGVSSFMPIIGFSNPM
jgi:hypothetical protein